MNIGETDADGWTYVRFGDAAKAAQEGAHEVERLHYAEWTATNFFAEGHQYRLREKARTITVTLPSPHEMDRGVISSRLIIDFSTPDQCTGALNAIRAAVEQS